MTQKGYLYSFDMLGEAARTEADALRYLKAYADAISSLDAGANGADIRQQPRHLGQAFGAASAL